MSSTYREDSKTTKEALEKDPADKFLERAPRIRLEAEEVRDQALCISGLMCNKMYGPSVHKTFSGVFTSIGQPLDCIF